MLIRVTQEDINNGRRFQCRDCPVALAARRAGLTAIEVASGEISGVLAGEFVSSELPEGVAMWVSCFDAGGHMAPLEFEVDL